MTKIGIIGGSGLDNPDFFTYTNQLEIDTPYGRPSALLKSGKINEVEVVLLARHGSEHTIPPSQVNYRANIYALKQIGCTHIIATTAVGSLKEEIKPGDLVILDQFIDFTRKRNNTYHQKFKPHNPKHTPMAEPFSKEINNTLIDCCEQLNLSHHKKGTVITIEGPRFSTKAESIMFRSWGADIINMSIATEAALANEIGIPYSAIAMSTDYDCWKEGEEAVTWEKILETFNKNVSNVTKLILNAVNKIQYTPPTEILKQKIRTIPNWPKPGIMFRDITTLLKDDVGFKLLIDTLYNRYKNYSLDSIVGIEARGFIIGSALAYRLEVGFVPIRKKGKLPGNTIAQDYQLEYGSDTVEIHDDAIGSGNKVLLIDDLIATGGTAMASAELLNKLEADIIECCFIIDLPDIGGMEKLKQKGYKTYSLFEFEGE